MPDNDKDNNERRQLWNYSQLGIQMGVIIGGAAWLGVWLDGKYPNDHQLYTIICTLSGVIIGLYLVIREVIRMSKDD